VYKWQAMCVTVEREALSVSESIDVGISVFLCLVLCVSRIITDDVFGAYTFIRNYDARILTGFNFKIRADFLRL
jgi:hypothetical protein